MLKYAFKYGLYPGIFLHEVAHALMIVLLPNMKITEFHPFSHVQHAGNYTVTRSFIISYAPFIGNTTISVLLLKYVSTYALQSILSYLFVGFIIYLVSVCMFTAFPSYEDAILPISIMREQLFTKRIFSILLFGPLFLLISIPVIGITYLNRNIYIRSISSILYVSVVVYLTLIQPELLMFDQITTRI